MRRSTAQVFATIAAHVEEHSTGVVVCDMGHGQSTADELLSPTHRTLFVGREGLEQAKSRLVEYKTGRVKEMVPDLWQAKKIVDSTLHPGGCGR
jgi:hypothetical protein